MFIEKSFSEKEWLSSVFHVVSASTTTGFQFIDLSLLSVNGKILLIVIMLIGGTAFSTAGGIKIARLMLIIEKIIDNRKHTSTTLMNKNNHATIPSFISATAIQFRKRIKPISNLHIAEENNKQMKCVVPLDKYKFNILSDKAFKEALFVIVLYILFTFITAICIYYIGNNNRSFIDTIFETASTISNTGFSTGITNMDLDSISKLILSFNMIMGRFEIIAILYIFISKLRR